MSESAVTERQARANFFRPRRLGHANLFVDNYEKSYDFYHAVVGYNEAYRQPDNMASFLSNGNTYHDIALTDTRSHYNREKLPAGLNHAAFELETEADLVKGYNAAKEAGVEFESVQDHDVARSLYFHDPDGNAMEIYADMDREWRKTRKGIIIKKKPKWVPGVTSEPLTEPQYVADPPLDVVSEAIFHPQKVTHIGLAVADFGAMFDYYIDFVGLSPMAGDRGSAFAVLAGTCGIGDVTLLRAKPGERLGLHHVGLLLPSEAELERSKAAAKAAGIAIEYDIDHPIRRAITISDPSGIRLQFYVNRDWSAATVRGLDEETARHLL